MEERDGLFRPQRNAEAFVTHSAMTRDVHVPDGVLNEHLRREGKRERGKRRRRRRRRRRREGGGREGRAGRGKEREWGEGEGELE